MSFLSGGPFALLNISIFQTHLSKAFRDVQLHKHIQTETQEYEVKLRAKFTKTSLLSQTDARPNETILQTWKSTHSSVTLVAVAGFTPFAPVGGNL